MSEMNDRSATTRSTARRCVGGEVADVEALDHHDALVVADARMELAVADVERDDLAGAALQQAVGEAAGRRAGIEHPPADDVDAERVERRVELVDRRG